MPKEYSAEVIALRDRVKLGNEKLFLAWQQIRDFADDKERWATVMDQVNEAQSLLQTKCSELKAKGYEDCLYIEGGKKTRSCSMASTGFFCIVCPSAIPYWEKELFDQPSPKVREHPQQGEKQKVFLEKLGEV